jgi:hypothetical protein
LAHIDSDDLYIHELSPQPGLPLNGAPAMNDGPTDETASQPENAFHTAGLMNPDGILGVVPGTSPLTIIYEQKILNGDNTGTTALPAAQQCNMARRFAAAISHAAGFSGIPSSGHRSRAATSASWASSSAMPISRVTRAIEAMSRIDSIFHTASIDLWTSLMFA